MYEHYHFLKDSPAHRTLTNQFPPHTSHLAILNQLYQIFDNLPLGSGHCFYICSALHYLPRQILSLHRSHLLSSVYATSNKSCLKYVIAINKQHNSYANPQMTLSDFIILLFFSAHTSSPFW